MTYLTSGFDIDSPDDTKILLLETILNLCKNESLIPELAQHGLIAKLCNLFIKTQNREVRLLTIRLLDTISVVKSITEFMFRQIKFNDVVTYMNTAVDLEPAKHCFHLSKNFVKVQALQNPVLQRGKVIEFYIMDCLKNPQIKNVDKIEALGLLRFLVSSP